MARRKGHPNQTLDQAAQKFVTNASAGIQARYNPAELGARYAAGISKKTGIPAATVAASKGGQHYTQGIANVNKQQMVANVQASQQKWINNYRKAFGG